MRKEEGRKGFRAPHLADNEGGEVRRGEERVAGEGEGGRGRMSEGGKGLIRGCKVRIITL